MQQKHLLVRAKRLRNDSTAFQVMLWRSLGRSQLGGHKFRRQHVVDNCIVDFFCPQKGLIIEIDGDTHDAAKDAIRDRVHEHQGFATLCFSNSDVGKNIDVVLSAILTKLASLPDRWPHPLAPSPEAEGG